MPKRIRPCVVSAKKLSNCFRDAPRSFGRIRFNPSGSALTHKHGIHRIYDFFDQCSVGATRLVANGRKIIVLVSERAPYIRVIPISLTFKQANNLFFSIRL